jgi:hypothetical protein
MTTNRLARPLALVAAAAFIVTACGGNAATTAPGTVAPATSGPVATAPGASADPGFSFALPSGLNADKDLESILPDELGGVAVTKLSMSGDDFLGEDASSEDLAQMMQTLGKAPSDLSVAFGGNASVVMIAFRVKGVDATTMYNAVLASQEAEDVGDITDVTIGGKAAKKLVDSTQTTSYLYLTGDAVVTVTSVGASFTDATLNEIFSKLP